MILSFLWEMFHSQGINAFFGNAVVVLRVVRAGDGFS